MPKITSHQLARLLLDQPDMEVATHANNHTADGGRLEVGILRSGSKQPMIIIGNFSMFGSVNQSNYWVDKCLTTEWPPEACIPDAGYIKREEEAMSNPRRDMRFSSGSPENLALMKKLSAETAAAGIKGLWEIPIPE